MIGLQRGGSTLSENETVFVLVLETSVLLTRAMIRAVGFIAELVFPENIYIKVENAM